MPSWTGDVNAFFDSFSVFDKSYAVAVTRRKDFIEQAVRAGVEDDIHGHWRWCR